jgi:hypothetical protein
MPLWVKRKIITNGGYFGLTSTAPHLTPSNRPSFSSLPRDLCDYTMCITRRHFYASFEAKQGNPSPTCFAIKQVTGC